MIPPGIRFAPCAAMAVASDSRQVVTHPVSSGWLCRYAV